MYYPCPECGWTIAFAFTPPAPDPDMGLVLAAHVQEVHPTSAYMGNGIVVSRNWRKLITSGLLNN